MGNGIRVDILELKITESDKTLLPVLNQFYLETRYPGERGQLAQEIDRVKASEYLAKTKETWECLRQMLL